MRRYVERLCLIMKEQTDILGDRICLSALFPHYLKLWCSCSPPAVGSAFQPVLHRPNRFGLSSYGPGPGRQKAFRAKRATTERTVATTTQRLIRFIAHHNGALVIFISGTNFRASLDSSEVFWFCSSSVLRPSLPVY